MESDVRCGGYFDEYPEVRAATWPRGVDADGCHSLLNDPNTNSPANVEASNLYKDNRKEYEKRVKAVVEESWEED